MTKEKEIEKILCGAIKQRRLINFYYESNTRGKIWRTIEPYIIATNQKENTILVGLPIIELSNEIAERVTPHYLLNKLDVQKIEVLDETYDEPHVERHRITHTPTIKVICRFMYPDEKQNK